MAEKVKQQAELAGSLAVARAFAADYVARNLLTDKAPVLMPLISMIDGALAGKNEVEIQGAWDRTSKVFEEAVVVEDYRKYVSATCGTRSLAGCMRVLEAGKEKVAEGGGRTNPQPAPAPMLSDRKVALVIGNLGLQECQRASEPPQ